MLIQTLAAAWLITTVAAPAPQYRAAKARRHFVSINYDWQYTHPMQFAKHPLEDLLGRPVAEVHLQPYQYQTRDEQTFVNVLDFAHRGRGVGVTLYPFGSSQGATLAIRGSIEQIPDIRLAFSGPVPAPAYELTGGRAYDLGAGFDVADRSAGWGLGSHAFLLGGFGRVRSDRSDGRRYFAEGGGGLSSGPFGVDVSVKIAVNRFTDPVPHRFFTIPISVRGTLTF